MSAAKAPAKPRAPRKAPKKRINLALQGGGAHGAFTWGVLERLLADETLEICAISGTSAGALNGAALKAGLTEGRQGAADNLEWLWQTVTSVGDLRIADWVGAFFPAPAVFSKALEFAVQNSAAEMASRVFSPYSYGPLYRNPLYKVVDGFRYDRVCAGEGPRLFVSCTNVRSGKIRVFTGSEITSDVIVASACLPTVFQAVEFEDPKTGKVEAFWDGGYTGNPALFPLFDQSLPDDIVIVNINPLERPDLPLAAPDILNRINEVSFNSSLLREVRAIRFVKDLIAQGRVDKSAMKDVLVHMISDDQIMQDLNVATKMVPTVYLVDKLRDAGRGAAETFLSKHRAKLNKTSSVDLKSMYE
ncbi:MAG: patatin-like phospholipase family protein [Pseudomonadota bacterium]